jgi:tetratricopeptide (TPR) repeat protein
MKRVSACLILLLCTAALAQQHPMSGADRPVTMIEGLGDLHHPVTTSNPEAQQFFDQGLRLIYAFNHAEAERSFRHAADLDPKLAMAYWGVAEAVGPNYNDPASDERFMQAHQAIQKAVDLSSGASASERAYINAMAKRFPADPKADRRKAAEEYRDAMRQVSKQFPDDLDAATLFAESSMGLHPWGLWHLDGTPEEGTEEIVTTLESVLKRDPNHLGAVHYYIHAVEASRNPDRALASANRLASLAPNAGHIVHMPAHVYIRTGDYDAAVKTNQEAAKIDEAYIKSSGAGGIYPMMYYSHNLHFIAITAAMEGRYSEAIDAAQRLHDHVAPAISAMPPLEGFMTIPMAVMVRFQKWDDILALPQPDATLKTTTTVWHYARGMAFASTGKLAEAQKEYDAVNAAYQATPPEAIFSMPFNNKSKNILRIATDVLGAKIATAKHSDAAAMVMLREAVATQDALNYGEPPDWYFPVRESLGAALLRSGNPQEAEKVFREDLAKNPRNPRSLFGLHESLLAQKRAYDAQFVQKQFDQAWKNSDVKLNIADL